MPETPAPASPADPNLDPEAKAKAELEKQQAALKPRRVSSLEEIVQVTKRAPAVPDPIVLSWYLPPSPEEPYGVQMEMEVKTRYPEDAWKFGIRYHSEIIPKKRSQMPDENGKIVPKHPDWDFVAIAREVVAEPTWLHNEEAVARFKKTVPSTTFAELLGELMLVAGLTGDFFARYQLLTVPKAYLIGGSGSANGSDSTPTPSPTPQQNDSSPGSPTSASERKSPAEAASPTTSGSSPSTPTTAQPA